MLPDSTTFQVQYENNRDNIRGIHETKVDKQIYVLKIKEAYIK
jgi:hypothetical protein